MTTVHSCKIQGDQLGLDWWDSGVPAEDVLRDHPGLLRLTDRQFDFLRMVGVNFPDKRKFCLELSHIDPH